MAADLKAARAFYADLAAALDRVPVPVGYTAAEWKASDEPRKAARAAIVALIERHGGAVHDDWRGSAVRLFGLRASSTSSLENACRNWMAQVTLKSAASA